MKTLATTIITILISTISFGQTCFVSNNCAQVEVYSELTMDNNVFYTFTVSVPEDCNMTQAISHVSFELPANALALSPLNNETYTSTLTDIAYNVENGTNTPFYSIKFNVAGEEGIKRGDTEVFEFLMPATADMTNTQVEVKIANNSIIMDMEISEACRIGGSLPVELSNFTGKALEYSNQLSWTTQSETNNYGFEIETSKNAENWTVIGFEKGMGTTTEINDYTFEDTRVLGGTNYYRLKQVNEDGSFDYSEIVAVKSLQKNLSVQAFPNPTTSYFTASFSNPQQLNASVQLANTQGQIIWATSFENNAPANWSETFDNLDSNVYFLIVTIGSQVETQRILVTK